MKLSFHQRGLINRVLREDVRASSLGHTRKRSLRSEAGRRYLRTDGRGFLRVEKRRARAELGLDTCFLCMNDLLGEDLQPFNFWDSSEEPRGVACRSCIETQERYRREEQRARQRAA